MWGLNVDQRKQQRPDGAEPHALVSMAVMDPLGALPAAGNTAGLSRHPPEHTEPPHCSFFRREMKGMLFSQYFTYSATTTVHPHLNRTAFLPKLGIIFHSTVTCLSHLARKAVKNNYFFPDLSGSMSL